VWSPDGTKIAFATERDGDFEIYVMDADGSHQTRLTNDPAGDLHPAWSPDGTKIAFTTDRGGNCCQIYSMNTDGSNPVRLTDDAAFNSDASWSPDGTKLAFATNRDGEFEIYSINADGTNPTNLTQSGAYDADPAWSPDGTMVAFTTNRNGPNQIAVVNADGSAQTTVISSGADGFPDWQPTASAEQVALDIKPGSDRNPINLRSRGFIPVAILSSADFDATSVDLSSVRFGDAEDASQRAAAQQRANRGDANGDGRVDLLMYFAIRHTGIDPGDTRACLNGTTLAGTAFQACDSITVLR
jgi:dipeptidyl aminopeptidase/acylaminoacyl peptidase